MIPNDEYLSICRQRRVRFKQRGLSTYLPKHDRIICLWMQQRLCAPRKWPRLQRRHMFISDFLPHCRNNQPKLSGCVSEQERLHLVLHSHPWSPYKASVCRLWSRATAGMYLWLHNYLWRTEFQCLNTGKFLWEQISTRNRIINESSIFIVQNRRIRPTKGIQSSLFDRLVGPIR